MTWRYWNDLPLDQLKFFIFANDARLDHATDILHRESSAWISLGGSGPCDVHVVNIPDFRLIVRNARQGSPTAREVFDATYCARLGAGDQRAPVWLLCLR